MIEIMTDEIAPALLATVQTRVLKVASTFTARPIGKKLQSYLNTAGIAGAIEFVEYGQVAEYMLGPAADDENILGTLVLARVEDSLRSEFKNDVAGTDSSARALQQLKANVDEFVKQIAALAKHGKPVWVLACPSDGWIADSLKLALSCRTYTNLLMARTRGTPNVTVLNWPSSLSPADSSDRNTDRLGQIPFTREAFDQLAQYLGPEIETGLATKAASVATASANGKADLANFLAGLEVRVRLARAQGADHSHVDRILRTAAAFSLTGENRDLSDAEVERTIESGRCLLISVSDRLSRYGASGVVSYRTEGDSLAIEALALSCPVLGKQVEFAVLSGLERLARSLGCARLVLEYRPSGRNQIMLKFLESIAQPMPDGRFTVLTGDIDERIRKTAVAPGTWTLELAE